MIVVSTRGITIDPEQEVEESTVKQSTLQK